MCYLGIDVIKQANKKILKTLEKVSLGRRGAIRDLPGCKIKNKPEARKG